MDKNIESSSNNHKEVAAVINDSLIQCARVSLKSCHLGLQQQNTDSEKNLEFNVVNRVSGQLLISELRLKLLNPVEENPGVIQILEFSLVGIFVATPDVKQETLGDFGKMFTFAILWPYAREFVHDILQRTGIKFANLPIINAQDTTQDMIKKGEITLEFIDDKSQKS